MEIDGRGIRFGVVLEEQHASARAWRDHVRRIEDAGVSTALVRDHVVPEPFGPQLAPISVLAALATCTDRLRIGSLVLDNDYRHPALVAHEAATIDWISEGRLELGLGAGWLQTEYRRMGLAFDSAGIRIERLEEAIRVIGELLSGDTVTFHGKHYHVDGFRLATMPVQTPRPPIVVGAGGPRMLTLAGRYADVVGILPAPIRDESDPDDPADRRAEAVAARIEHVRRGAGARFDAIELSMFATFVIDDDRRAATERVVAERGWSGVALHDVWEMPSLFVGSVGQIVADLRARHAELGLSYFVTSDRHLDTLARIIDRL